MQNLFAVIPVGQDFGLVYQQCIDILEASEQSSQS